MSIQRVINFSGGKTSAYMTITEYRKGDIVLFCDTGREHPKTYKFINDFEAFENIPVVRISYPGGFEAMLAKRDYKRIPYMMNAFCRDELKIYTAKRYLKSIGVLRFENFIGFRHDEQRRILRWKEGYKKVTTKFPLNERKITKEDIKNYWLAKSYTLEIPSILGNCTLCFRKGPAVVMAILREFPELAEPWINDEKQAAKQLRISQI